jgi:hypothetical protein
VVGVLQVVSEKSAPVNGAAGTGDSPGPPQLVEPVTFVNLSDIGIVVVVGAAVVVVVVAAAVVVVVAAAVVVVVVGAAVVVVVVGAAVVVVVGAAVVVVVEPRHEPSAPHASQQLGTDPTHAVPPRGALQSLPRCLIEQLVLPLASVWQQVTKPGMPQVDCSAHCTTTPPHWGRSDPPSTAASATCSTQFT